MTSGFAPHAVFEQEEALRSFLYEHRSEFIRASAVVAGEFVILEAELDRLVSQFLRGANRLN